MVDAAANEYSLRPDPEEIHLAGVGLGVELGLGVYVGEAADDPTVPRRFARGADRIDPVRKRIGGQRVVVPRVAVVAARNANELLAVLDRRDAVERTFRRRTRANQRGTVVRFRDRPAGQQWL